MIERRSGTRTATTLRKLPSASAGASTTMAAAAFTAHSPVDRSNADAARAHTFVGSAESRTTTVTSLTCRPAPDRLPRDVRVDPVRPAVRAGESLDGHVVRARSGPAGDEVDPRRGARLVRRVARVRGRRGEHLAVRKPDRRVAHGAIALHLAIRERAGGRDRARAREMPDPGLEHREQREDPDHQHGHRREQLDQPDATLVSLRTTGGSRRLIAGQSDV